MNWTKKAVICSYDLSWVENYRTSIENINTKRLCVNQKSATFARAFQAKVMTVFVWQQLQSPKNIHISKIYYGTVALHHFDPIYHRMSPVLNGNTWT